MSIADDRAFGMGYTTDGVGGDWIAYVGRIDFIARTGNEVRIEAVTFADDGRAIAAFDALVKERGIAKWSRP